MICASVKRLFLLSSAPAWRSKLYIRPRDVPGSRSELDVASYFGVSIKIIEEVYGHHSEDHQSTAHEAMEGRR
ncbi:hypothetical protein CK240_17560 [Paracoccus salipaludis]|uniref:Uncharacterized protein n=1 Tax=Paracoccus salipaludis TaxID=2032623 RepID=A0A2A2G7C9_9RHOB|nr:hypothetical protein CK240_17560 [Paracoccus salipaludis]